MKALDEVHRRGGSCARWGVVVAATRAGLRGRAHGGEVSVPTVTPAPELPFADVVAPGAELRISARARALDGARVRVMGFMANMELPPRGGLYLVPRPVHCDEAGGETADVPLESVLVVAPSTKEKRSRSYPGALEVTGTFEVGN